LKWLYIVIFECDGKFRSCSERIAVAHAAARPDKTRRTLVLAALVAGTCFATTRPLAAEDDRPGSDERPEASDLLVFPTATVKATS
jgi:hypothetical protein